jgi:hypothetical protein
LVTPTLRLGDGFWIRGTAEDPLTDAGGTEVLTVCVVDLTDAELLLVKVI